MLLKIGMSFALINVTNVTFVKRCQMFFLSYKIVTFFYPKTDVANNQEAIPYQPVLWRIFISIIDKNNKKFRIEIEKSVPNRGLVLNYGKTC